MKIIQKKILSWEPLEIHFVPIKKKTGWGKEVFAWIQQWDSKRSILGANLESTQMPLEYYIASVLCNGTVVVHIEWLCENALPIFEKFIRESGNNIKILEIGGSVENDAKIEVIGPEVEFIKIPKKIIYEESGREVEVPSFEISKYPITVRQFDEFVKDTKYKTTNEKMGEYRTYINNDCLIGMSNKEKMSTEAVCISFEDATAYCKWSGFRLPLDEEWLAAAVIDWSNEYKEKSISEGRWNSFLSNPKALKRISHEWINEFNAKSNTSVVRRGPVYCLFKGWRRRKLKKRHAIDYSDLFSQFRVCKLKP